jgi:hypothetical protein
MQAEIFIGVEPALPMKDADLAPGMGDDPALAIGKLRDFGDEHFRHVQILIDSHAKKYGQLAPSPCQGRAREAGL